VLARLVLAVLEVYKVLQELKVYKEQLELELKVYKAH
jgi:hypothetical protein